MFKQLLHNKLFTELYMIKHVSTHFIYLLSLLFYLDVNGQTLTISSGVTNLGNTYIGGNTNVAVFGFTVNPSSAVTLGTVVISHNALTAANLNGSFTNYRIGTCTTSAYSFATFTNIAAATLTVNTNDITFSTLGTALAASTTRFFFIVANVNSTFAAGFPLKTVFSLNNSVTTTFKNSLGLNIATNAYGRINNILTPNLARTQGTAFYWDNIPNTSQNTNSSKTSAVTGIIDGNTVTNITPPSDVSARLFYQAAGITWPTTKNHISKLKYYNASFNSLSPTDNNYFHDSVRVQFATDALATNWADAGGWISTPTYPVNRTGNNSGANGATFIFTGPVLNGVTGLRVIGQLRTDTPTDLYSYALGVREIEIYPVSVYYFKPTKSAVASLSNWGENEDGTGTIPTSFTEPTQFYFRSSETLNANITSSAQTTFSVGAGLDAGVTFTMGTYTINNATINIPLAITSGTNTLELGGATAPIIGLLSQGTLGSTVTYNGGVQTVGNYNYNNLTINYNGTKTLGGNTTVNRTLTISNPGNPQLAIGSNTLTLNGTITGLNTNQRNIIANGSSNLVIGGSGALGTLFFDQTTAGKSFGTGNTDYVPLSQGTTNRLNNLTINRTSSGIITLGNEVQITNLLTLTAGTLECGTPTNGANLVMLSTDATTSSIGDLTNATINGKVNVQSFFKGGTVAANRGYRMISSPIAEVAAPNNFFNKFKERFTVTCFGGIGAGCDVAPTKQPNAQTLTSYLEAGLTRGAASFVNINHDSTMKVGKGYYFFFRGNRNNMGLTNSKINEPFLAPEDWTATYIGTVNSGNITESVTKNTSTTDVANDGLNLIGNPYPSVLNFTNFRNDTDNIGIIDNFVKIIKRDRTGFFDYSNGILNGTLTNVESAGASPGTAQFPYIQPGQGFFVRKTNVGAPIGTPQNITFKETHKAAAVNSVNSLRTLSKSFKNEINEAKIYPTNRKLIRYNIQSNDSQEDATIVLEDGNSKNYDNKDAPYMANNTIYTYSLTADSIATAINFMPAVTNINEINLFVESIKSDANLKLNFTELVGAGKNELWLKDNYTQTNTLITTANNSYTFAIDKKIKATSGKDRFVLFFVPKIIYEINLSNFTATVNNIGVQLNWETESEINASKFELQRSVDGITFETINTQVSKTFGGNSSEEIIYSFLDKTPNIGTLYYKLKMLVKDGTQTYSETKTINFNFNEKNAVIVYPSLVKNDLNVIWNIQNKENYTLAIYDTSGKMILNYKNIKGQNFAVNVSSLSAGMYIVKINGQTTNSQVAVSKFVKQ